MTSTRAISAAAGVIHAAMQQGKTLPVAFAYALDSACLLNSPETAAELILLRARVAELEAAAGDGSTRTVDEDPIAYALTPAAELGGLDGAPPEALHASSGAVVETAVEDVSPQVRQLRELIGRQREDVYRSPLHHDYEVPHDLPEVRP